MLDATHTEEAPEIVPALGKAFTVREAVALKVPHELDTV
jgi:hypothetical protein